MSCYEELVVCEGCGAAHVEGNEVLCEKCKRQESEGDRAAEKSPKETATSLSKIGQFLIALSAIIVLGMLTCSDRCNIG